MHKISVQRPVGHIGVVHVPAAAVALPALRKVVPEAEGADDHLRRLQQEGDEFDDLGVAEQVADALALEDVDAPALVGVLFGPLHQFGLDPAVEYDVAGVEEFFFERFPVGFHRPLRLLTLAVRRKIQPLAGLEIVL